jgi:putative lipase involved disintegration of autophagic bodies
VQAATFLVRIVRPEIWRALEQYRAEGVDVDSEVEVLITGHSLGGAAASIAALELQVCRAAVRACRCCMRCPPLH